MGKASGNRDFPWITQYDVAHRGLFRPGTPAEENTAVAVAAAVKAGYAVEIDVRMTADDIIIVFHDDTLDRMTDGEGSIGRFGYERLKQYTVGASGKPIPPLTDILDAIDSERPLYVEIKSDMMVDIQKLCAGVRRSFEGYPGPVAIMSFDPRIVQWFRNYMPDYARGLIIGREFLLGLRKRLALSLWVQKAQPDFLACDINLLPNSFCEKWRKKGKPVLTWTVRTDDMEAIARQHADRVIFEAPAVVGPGA
jgi:glycerophosphoryl diester phosphodiesterase